MRVLVVKMSSLGDVVHTLPALTDARRALGGEVTFDWVVEEAFAAIPALHPGVERVIPVGWRSWRQDLRAHRHDLGGFLSELRRRRYDLVLDAQGLIKSGAVTAAARGADKAGLARGSAREGAAAWFYRRRVGVPKNLHAIERLRRLFAGALGYDAPHAPPDYGIAGAMPAAASTGARPRCVLLHGTTWASKHWPPAFWRLLAERALGAGFDVVVPWGSEDERARARDIAAANGARVLPRLPLAELVHELAGAALVIGVDSGLAHLAAALEAPTVVVYGSTSSELTGCRGRRVVNLQAAFPCAPCLRRECAYTGPTPESHGVAVVPACYSSVTPDRVWRAATELIDADRVLHL